MVIGVTDVENLKVLDIDLLVLGSVYWVLTRLCGDILSMTSHIATY